MPNLSVLTFTWSGTPVVGAGATVVHCNAGDENSAIAAMNTFWAGVKGDLPPGITIAAPVSGPVLDELSGKVVTTWSAGASGPTASSGTGTWVNGVGARCTFPTIGIRNGRHVTGAIFLVPLQISSYEGAGNIVPAAVARLQAAAIALGTTANGIRIYSRPNSLSGGVSYPTLTGKCPDLVSWLRSRRT